MLHAFGADQRIGDSLNFFRFASHQQNFQAVIMIQMNMHRREDALVMLVLHIRQFLAE